MHTFSGRALSRPAVCLSVAIAAAASLTFASTARADGVLDQVYRFEHQVPIGAGRGGRSLHVTETFTARSFLRPGPARAILMLPGPLSPGSFFNIGVPGYDGGAIMARRGFFAYAVDFEGTGTSTYPVEGTDVTLESQVAALDDVVRYVQLLREVPLVDLLGESWGGGVAAEVCKAKHSTRSCILASMIYETPSALAQEEFQSPAWLAFLQAQPSGYLQTSAAVYAPLVVSSSPAVQAWTNENLPGSYTIEPLLEFFALPFFDPGEARVPGLIIQGELDPQSIPSDVQALGEAYGQSGAVGVVTIAGGGHIPRIEPAPHNTEFWDAVTDFVDGP